MKKALPAGEAQASTRPGVRALSPNAGRPNPASQPPARSGGPRRRHRDDDGDFFEPNSLLAELNGDDYMKVVSHASDEFVSEEEFTAIQQLVEVGRQKGFVTYDDILRFFPEAEHNVDQLDEAHGALLAAGIEVVDSADSDEPSDDDMDDTEAEIEDEKPVEDAYLSAIDADDTIGLYLKEIGRVPLLTAAEEVSLAKRIEKAKFARERIVRGTVTPPKRRDLEYVMSDGMAAREHLITANSRLVISVAKKYIGRGVPFLDLIQEGNIGLIRAAKKFDYHRGHKFSTYAT
ncbi:MAG TPA: sigma-70 family RNA polymerase sigma factor, partial [Anaerolineales bacterium]|nr:sigma-70 family RNA polymerase sigma factor [Anaerolineales bacterium]